ncbi:MAG TPA: hypothetical protein ENI23_00575 [bacterium]|nr:hypothetical protein [bacterium]
MIKTILKMLLITVFCLLFTGCTERADAITKARKAASSKYSCPKERIGVVKQTELDKYIFLLKLVVCGKTIEYVCWWDTANGCLEITKEQ